ncbi:MAG: DNA-binding protein [Jatrophihabitantaceae bacterium]
MTLMKLEVLGRFELEQVLGVSRTRLAQLMLEPDFPAARWPLKMGKAWAMEDIEAYASAKGRVLHPLDADQPS